MQFRCCINHALCWYITENTFECHHPWKQRPALQTYWLSKIVYPLTAQENCMPSLQMWIVEDYRQGKEKEKTSVDAENQLGNKHVPRCTANQLTSIFIILILKIHHKRKKIEKNKGWGCISDIARSYTSLTLHVQHDRQAWSLGGKRMKLSVPCRPGSLTDFAEKKYSTAAILWAGNRGYFPAWCNKWCHVSWMGWSIT